MNQNATKYQVPINDAVTSINEVTVGSFFIDVMDGVIIPYKNNRGHIKAGGISKRRVDEMSTNFTPAALGSFHIAKQDDGTYLLLDGHHRIETLRLLNKSGKLTAQLKAQIIPVIAVRSVDWLKAYQGVNRSKSHNGPEKLMNDDLLPGSYIRDWENLSNSLFTTSQAVNLFDIALMREDKLRQGKTVAFTIEEVWNMRTKGGVKVQSASYLSDHAINRRNFSLDNTTEKDILAALKFYKLILKEAENDVAGYNEAVERALKSNGLFQIIISDYIGGTFEGFTRKRSPQSIYRKVRSKPHRVLDYAKLTAKHHPDALPWQKIVDFFR
jgi:hypothetical protein